MSRYEEEKGYPPYHPAMMVKVLLYAYCIGVPSSRKIEKRLCEDIAFRALAGLFLQALKLCWQAGLVKLGHVALDGTKIKANASKHKAMSYKRMKEEDGHYGKDKRGDELPKELAFRESRLKKGQEAKQALEAEAKAETKVVASTNKKHSGVPDDKAQRNFTDPESRIMPAPGGKHFIQADNAQAVVDSVHQVIVAAEVTNQPSDRGQAEPMMEIVKVNTGQLPRQLSVDAGYFSSGAVQNLTTAGIDIYMPPDKIDHRESLPPAPRGRIPKNLSIVDRMWRKLRTKKGRQRDGLRKVLPEPVFGQIKQARGFNQFLLRGEDKADSEWKVICASHNLLKLFRARIAGLVGQEFWEQLSAA